MQIQSVCKLQGANGRSLQTAWRVLTGCYIKPGFADEQPGVFEGMFYAEPVFKLTGISNEPASLVDLAVS